MGLESLSSSTGESKNNQPSNFEQEMNDYPPFNKATAEARVAEAKKTPEERAREQLAKCEYLTDMDPKRRSQIIDTSAEITKDIPDAVIIGGNALRILYEAKTGKTMFGVSKNDHDINVPREKIQEYINNDGVNGWSLDREKDADGNYEWIRPQENYVVINQPDGHEHIDVFGVADIGSPETVTIDGKEIRIQSLNDQIKDKVKLMFDSDGLSKLDSDSQDKYGVHAQRLLEIVDASPQDVDESQLPEEWRETLEEMAAQGRFGKNADPAKAERFKEMLAREKERREKIEQKKRELVKSLKSYYNQAQTDENAELSGEATMLSSYADQVDDILHKSSSADNFIQSLLSELDRDTLGEIKESIEESI